MQTAVIALLFAALLHVIVCSPLSKHEEKKLEKRSLYTEKSFGLTGMEKISKRSAEGGAEIMDDKTALGEVRDANHPSISQFVRNKRSDDMETAESGVYFLPSFARRGKRSVSDDMETAESGVYFLPSFARRGKRSVSDDMETAESGVYVLPSIAKRVKRSDMETAASVV